MRSESIATRFQNEFQPIKRLPKLLRAQVVEWKPHVEARRPAIRHERAVAAETEDEAGAASKDASGKFARLHHVEDAQEKQRLVRGFSVTLPATCGRVELRQFA